MFYHKHNFELTTHLLQDFPLQGPYQSQPGCELLPTKTRHLSRSRQQIHPTNDPLFIKFSAYTDMDPINQ